MREAAGRTSAESASRIMGRACIRIEEVLELFPEARNWVNPEDYRIVPFSQKMLFYLSGHPSQYVLIPAVPYRRQSELVNFYDFEKFIKERFPVIKIDMQALYRMTLCALNNNLCPQKWYLLSGSVLKKTELAQNKSLGNLPFRIERSLVYLYAWALFRRLRGRSLFKGRHFVCNDFFSAKRQMNIVLFLNNLNVVVHELNRDLNPLTGKVPSIVPFESEQNAT